ncbi:MAG TPA: ATP synthase F1 subunit delta [Saprospiraceae bacterium]|jgi:F-type H+-transporting ATPase subunit delta|nr:ATP synthase F1 subunit delta [Saprospiraceae bacterium]HRO09033.1 ATP synthase F1 subunit delta [Saprospiraceae bacterium]HRO73160.1 ATP synthase F1 subunit delta [Saprospiraceae bacterium]HRP42380.1 ATP synthase F1 subunit delta [Saprospiraceae bacterium]
MSIIRISARYAKSLLDIASERNELEAVKKDIEYFIAALQNRDMLLFLKSPIIHSNKKLSVMKALFDGKMGKTTMAFFDIVIRKGREMYLPDIAKEFISQYKQLNNISTVKITTATPISDTALNQIKTKLVDDNRPVDKLDIQTEVNPDIMGGFIIEIGDKLYDASVLRSLEQLKKEFSQN